MRRRSLESVPRPRLPRPPRGPSHVAHLAGARERPATSGPIVIAHAPAPHVGARAGAPATAPSESGFADGVRLVERGDYAAAAERLEAFHADHPSDARGEDAAFLTVIALQRAGRRDEARAAAHRYLAQYPKGYRRAEAEAIAAGQ